MRNRKPYILFLIFAGILMAAAAALLHESLPIGGRKAAGATQDASYGRTGDRIEIISPVDYRTQNKDLKEEEFSASRLLWQGACAACDQASATVYIPCDLQQMTDMTEILSGLMPADSDAAIYVCRDEKMTDPAAAAEEGYAFEGFLASGKKAANFKIILTGLPAICMEKTDSDEIKRKEEHEADFRYIPLVSSMEETSGKVSSAEANSAETAYTEAASEDTSGDGFVFPCTFHVRGNVSSTFDKKPYKITLTDRRGENVKVSLGGLRADDDWILNPLFTDSTRVREMTAYSLWDQVNAFSEMPQASSRMQYVELFLDNAYQGIYGLMEPIDGRQLGLETGDILYKIDRWDREYPYIDLYDESAGKTEIYNDKGFSCVEIRYPKEWDATASWLPMQAWHTFSFKTKDQATLADADLSPDMDSVVSLSLYCALTHAMDNNWKNSFLIAKKDKEGGYRLYRTIWDLNYVFGDVFVYEPENGYTAFDSSTAYAYTPGEDSSCDFEAFLEEDPSLKDQLCSKWRIWREGGVSADNVCSLARDNMKLLTESGAMDREMERWPQQESYGDALDEMEEWIRNRFLFLDRIFDMPTE